MYYYKSLKREKQMEYILYRVCLYLYLSFKFVCFVRPIRHYSQLWIPRLEILEKSYHRKKKKKKNLAIYLFYWIKLCPATLLTDWNIRAFPGFLWPLAISGFPMNSQTCYFSQNVPGTLNSQFRCSYPALVAKRLYIAPVRDCQVRWPLFPKSSSRNV